jgi:hypothetical protein
MKILFFGDIVGQPSREALKKIVPELKKELAPDLVVANCENSAHGTGFSEKSVAEIMAAGVDWLTSGDHTFDVKEADTLLGDKKLPVLRPLNWPGNVPGRGYEIITLGARRILLVSLMGRVFMRRDVDDPFIKIKELLEDYSLKGKEQGSESVDAIIIDFHAEATSEKVALGWFLDGQISALFGTHTHIPTADERILPQGTAYISDVGMTGPRDSVLGVDKEIVIKRFLSQRLIRMEVSGNSLIEVDAVLLEIDDKTGLAQNIVRIKKEVVLE